MLSLIRDGILSGKLGKQVFEEMYRTGEDPKKIVERKGWVQIQDEEEVHKVVEEILSAHPDEVGKYRAGKEKLFGFLVGEVMKATKGKANPKLVNEILLKRLKEGR
jgi:aspartyl-tRNA(Asn)/glutamyl-tRNA(Gln) amidotransferase subunit B